MPPRSKRKRSAVKAEPPCSSSDATRVWQGHAKRVKAEPGDSGEEEASDTDVGAVSDEVVVEVVVEMSDDEQGFVVPGRCVQRPARSVRRSAGGRAPQRDVDVSALYEEVGVGQLARSLGQVVKEEALGASVVSCVNVESGDESPLRVSDYVRRAAAVRAEQLLRGDETSSLASDSDSATATVWVVQRPSGRKRSTGFKFTEEQRAVLRAQFDVDPYPDSATKEGLCEQLGVEYKSVQYWFDRERRRRGLTNSNYDSARNMCKFGPAVYDELVAQFELNPRPDLATRKALATKAGASVKQIYHWFATRRRSQRDPTQKVEISAALREELEAVFKANPYPNRETRAMIAGRSGCSMEQILAWFHSRRQKAGIKQSKEEHARRVCPFGPEGYDRIVAQFELNPYPDKETGVALATELGGTVKQVSTWFYNRRCSEGIASKDSRARQLCSLGPAAYDELVAAFEADPFPDRKTRAALMAKTGGTPQQITSWICWRRRTEGIRSGGDAYARSMCQFGVQVYDEPVAQFEADPFPDIATMKQLAQKACGTPKQISNWFSSRRRRFGIQHSNEEWSRQRCKFGPVVYHQLVAQFEDDPYPSADVIAELAAIAGATAKQISNWFWYRRKKCRK